MSKVMSEKEFTALRFTADALVTRPREYPRILEMVRRRSTDSQLHDALTALEKQFDLHRPRVIADVRAIAGSLAPEGEREPDSPAELAGTALTWSLASERLHNDE